jgi:quinol monooxygenase YgiN
MIHVVAIITAKADQRPTLLKTLKANIPAVHAERGCIEYGVTIDADGASPAFGPDAFVVIEKWETIADLKAHSTAPHMIAYAEKAKPLLATRVVHVLQPA